MLKTVVQLNIFMETMKLFLFDYLMKVQEKSIWVYNNKIRSKWQNVLFGQTIPLITYNLTPLKQLLKKEKLERLIC